MLNNNMIMKGREISSSVASAQFRNGNNAAINGFAAKSRTDKAVGNSNFSSVLKSEAKAYERSGYEQEKRYQQEKKDILLGKK